MNIIVFGTSEYYQKNKHHIYFKTNNIVAFLDNDRKKEGLMIDGSKVLFPSELKNQEYDEIVIMSTFYTEIEKQLLLMGVEKNLIKSLDDILYSHREYMANLFLKKGDGIEIGALHRPIRLNSDVYKVRYVDRMSKTEIRKIFLEELKEYELVDVDYIEDGEKLHSIENNSLDFIIANHFLEHCKNLISTLKIHLEKLKLGGTLFYALPDKRFTFDIERDLTTFEHFKKEFLKEQSQFIHYYDCYLNINKENKLSEEQIIHQAFKSMREDANIHFHVWDIYSFTNILINIRELLEETFEIVSIQLINQEIVCILKKVSNKELTL